VEGRGYEWEGLSGAAEDNHDPHGYVEPLVKRWREEATCGRDCMELLKTTTILTGMSNRW
jgi:hypothetical protein